MEGNQLVVRDSEKRERVIFVASHQFFMAISIEYSHYSKAGLFAVYFNKNAYTYTKNLESVTWFSLTFLSNVIIFVKNTPYGKKQ